MATIKKIKPKNEKELHSVIEKELDALEEGLKILKYEFAMTKGIPDFLCVDSGGRLVVIEVKLQEDPNVLFQALRYFSEIDQDRYALAKLFPKEDIDPDEHPRIVLIAEKFPDDLRRLSTLVKPDVELYEYTLLATAEGKEGICFHPMSLPKIEEQLKKPVTFKQLRDYITKDSLKPLFDKIIPEIKGLAGGIESHPTQDYVGFKYRGRQIGWLGPKRKSFDIGSHIIDEKGRLIDYESIRIETGEEDYSEILEKILTGYKNLIKQEEIL